MTQTKRTSNGLWLDTDATRTDGADRGHGMNAEDSGRQMLSFDIYLKVNVSRAISFFKLQEQRERNQRFRMFPYVGKRRVDEYGKVIDVAISGSWKKKTQMRMPRRGR
ncbi:hypothetical protein BGY98DRAFT_626980 [Russula aff. rugulosa BPL654]|nr:hypothetical protein BGY98DRAFT_626980 [Russula aff. rugulosa BPL654]